MGTKFVAEDYDENSLDNYDLGIDMLWSFIKLFKNFFKNRQDHPSLTRNPLLEWS